MLQEQSVNPETHTFPIRVAGTDLNFRQELVADPVPTGRQIIAALEAIPQMNSSFSNGSGTATSRKIDLDETTDLRAPGAERFIVARSDRTYRFEIDGKRHEWRRRQFRGRRSSQSPDRSRKVLGLAGIQEEAGRRNPRRAPGSPGA